MPRWLAWETDVIITQLNFRSCF